VISLSHVSARPDPIAVGPIVMTDTVRMWIDQKPDVFNEIHENLLKYLGGDWGEIDSEDWPLNVATIKGETPNGRLMGAYSLGNGEKMWIITDGYGNQHQGFDHCHTTILSPDDY
jgi:hypothetical protein